ncbi:brachyurin-like [Neocloeon triangulifer]|uniref:brachyurin-like n=1 Tax=Neocloeon triangulifer TaxID=2078957 RepID=UPI00286EDB7F|nr:brachyurin-like [Neocloeon triangulifer]
MILDKKIWVILTLSVATLVVAEMSPDDEFLTPFEMHKKRAYKVSKVDINQPEFMGRKGGPTEQVYGGSEGNETLPFMVYLESLNAQNVTVHQCSGTIVNESWIITAAQCFERANWTILTLGSIDRTSADAINIITYPSQWVIHEKFIYNGREYDIALVNLTDTPLTLSATIAVMPLCCPSLYKQKLFLYNETVTVFGFGSTLEPSDPDCPVEFPASVFHAAEVKMANNTAFCSAQLWEHYIDMASTQFCSSSWYNRTAGACDVDSGGPVAYTQSGGLGYCIAGVNSMHGYENCPNSYPFTVTDMQLQYKWVLSKMKAKPAKC